MSGFSPVPMREGSRLMSGLLPVAVCFAAARPHLLIPAWVCALSGAARVADPVSPSRSLTLAVCAWSLALVATHLVNLVADRDGDRRNAKNLFWQGRVSGRCLGVAAGVGAVAALLCGYHGGVTAFAAVAATLALGALYSLPPVRMAHRWGWDLAANTGGYAATPSGTYNYGGYPQPVYAQPYGGQPVYSQQPYAQQPYVQQPGAQNVSGYQGQSQVIPPAANSDAAAPSQECDDVVVDVLGNYVCK